MPELQAIADRRLSLCGVGGGMSAAAVEKIKRDCKKVQREVAAHVANSARELASESALAAHDIAGSIAALSPQTQASLFSFSVFWIFTTAMWIEKMKLNLRKLNCGTLLIYAHWCTVSQKIKI